MKYFLPYVRERTELRHASVNNHCIVEPHGNGPQGGYWRQRIEAGLRPERVPMIYCLENSTMKLLKRLSALFLAVTLVSVLGCSSTPTQESTGEYMSDSWITTKVKAALVDSPQVKATEVNVETFKGVVQLSGFVGSYSAQNEAVRITRGIEGVKSVKNDMRVK